MPPSDVETAQGARASSAPALAAIEADGDLALEHAASAPTSASARLVAVSAAAHEDGERRDIEHSSDAEVARLTRSFFSAPPAPADAHENWDDAVPPPPMTLDARRAMYATLGIFGVSLVLMLGYLAYTRLIMPVPVDLGRGAELPRLEMAPPPQPVVEPPPAAAPAKVTTAAAAPMPAAPDPAAAAAAAAAAATPAAAAAPAPAAAAATPAPALAATLTLTPTLAAAAAPTPTSAPAPAATPASDTIAPTAAPPPANPQTAALLAQAEALFGNGRKKESLTAYEAVISADPNASAALSRAAYLHLEAGNDERAQQYASRAVALDATSSEGWIVLGAALESKKDRAGARDAYAKCVATGQGAYVHECRRLAR